MFISSSNIRLQVARESAAGRSAGFSADRRRRVGVASLARFSRNSVDNEVSEH